MLLLQIPNGLSDHTCSFEYKKENTTGFRKQTKDAGTSHQTVPEVTSQTNHEAFFLSATCEKDGQRNQRALK